MTVVDSLLRALSAKDSLLALAATRAQPVTVRLVPESPPWWRTELVAGLAGAVVGALITLLSTVLWDRAKALQEKERGRRLLRQAMQPTVFHCRNVAGLIQQHGYVDSAMVAEIAADIEAFAQRQEILERFKDPRIAMRFNGWYANLRQGLAFAQGVEYHLKGQTERRMGLPPDFEENIGTMAFYFRRLATWGSHIYALLGAADRCSTRPWVRQLCRRTRRSLRAVRTRR